MKIPVMAELVQMKIDYKVGDIVEAWAVPSQSFSVQNGQTFEVLDIMTAMVKVKRISDGHTTASIYKQRFRLCSECHECIYACKTVKKCPLYTEVKK